MSVLSSRGARSRGAREARAQGEHVAQTDAFEWLARGGLVARGVVYLIIGILAIRLAFGAGGETTDQQGALQEIAQGPFGKVLLVVMALGLAGYAIWRLMRAALGHGQEASDDTKDRISALVSGIAYTILCATAVQIIVGSSSGGGGGPEKATGGVLDWPAGRYLVILAGLIVIGVAVDQGIKGVKKKFLEDSKTGEMRGEHTEQVFTAVGVAGHLARMVVFALIGWFLIDAAISYDPDKAVGLDGALAKLSQSGHGPILLGVVAAGLLAFAAYSILDARYRRV